LYETPIPKLDRALSSLFNTINRTVEEEWQTMSAVFPNSMSVLQLFVQRIFAQTVRYERSSLFLLNL
jgi:hypothetical protein